MSASSTTGTRNSERSSGWKVANTILVATLWVAILVLGIVDCKPIDSSAAQGGFAHFFLWILIGFFLAVGAVPHAWRRIAWPQKLMTVCAAVAVLDVVGYDLVGNCMLHLNAARARAYGLYAPLSVIAFAVMVALPTSFVALLAAALGRGETKETTSDSGAKQ